MKLLLETNPVSLRYIKGWLFIGIAALLVSGLYSVLLVTSRTPLIQELIPIIDLFHVALVVHVDLSVLIWFMSFAAVFWSHAFMSTRHWLGPLSLIVGGIGLVLIIFSPFLGSNTAYTNNYLPMLDGKLFTLGLSFFACGFILLAILALWRAAASFSSITENPNRLAVTIAALYTLATVAAFFWTYATLPTSDSPATYYEYLFWGPGHILQFCHLVLVIVAWHYLLIDNGLGRRNSTPTLAILILLSVLPLFSLPIIYIDPVDSPELIANFVALMKWGSLVIVPWALFICRDLFVPRTWSLRTPTFAALISSLLLFLIGGVLGFMIEGVNVVIPAHYHGSIVGITLAYMGLAYYFLPVLGYRKPQSRLAKLQPLIYGGGQLLHILGLAWSGGYGVQRKTAGAAQGLDRLPEIMGMGMMGFGGLIASIGGLLFLVVVYQSVSGGKVNSAKP